MPFQGYTSDEVCKLLRRSRQSLALSGVFEHITKSYPFGSKSQLPLYNIEEVDTLAKKFVRFDAAIAFETIKRKTPLLQVWEDPEYSDPARDITCPKCNSAKHIKLISSFSANVSGSPDSCDGCSEGSCGMPSFGGGCANGMCGLN